MDESPLQLVRSKSSLNYGNILPAASLLLLESHSPLRRTATLSSSHRTASSTHGIRIQYTGSALLGQGGSPSPVTTCWAHGGAGISILLSLCRVLLRAHAARLTQPREALLPPIPHSRFLVAIYIAMRAVEDTGISILLAGYAESTRVHLDNIGRTI